MRSMKTLTELLCAYHYIKGNHQVLVLLAALRYRNGNAKLDKDWFLSSISPEALSYY